MCRSFQNGKIELGDIIHIVKDRFGSGKDEVWTCEWDDNLGRFYAYNQLNSCRYFEYDEDLKLIVRVHPNFKFYPEKIERE